jgi:D-alanyl-D-alanine carboxypeptidase/D-alanyl-D-alanine-endopeptidase (penicillin-binding protein 4)
MMRHSVGDGTAQRRAAAHALRVLLFIVLTPLTVRAQSVNVQPTAAQVKWRGELDAIINAPEFRHSHWGVLAVDLKTGRTLYEHQPDKLFAPASVTKLFSTAAALDALGAGHRFVTPVYARGTTVDDRLDGDLVLVASGDPTFGGRTDAQGHIEFKDIDHTYAGFSQVAELTDGDPTAGLKTLARRVYDSGIHQVTGEVIVDDRLFTHAIGSGSGPQQLTPIMVNDNVLDFTIIPHDEVGQPAEVVWRPHTSAYMVDVQVDTGADDSPSRVTIHEPTPGRIVVRGSIAHNRRPTVLVQEVEQPASFARSLFIEALREAGVKVTASPLASNPADKLPRYETYATQKPIAEFTSPPFSENAKLVLKVSHNLHAGTLPLLVAAKNGKQTLPEGLRLQRDFLNRVGVDATTISFAGGAGGDRADYVTPRATVKLLEAMSKRSDFAAYRDALPVLGVDGTLAAAVAPESPAKGKVQAKTGTLVWGNLLQGRSLLQAKGLAGYIDAADGRTIVFAAFVNLVHLQNSADRDKIGRVLGTIAEKLYAAP